MIAQSTSTCCSPGEEGNNVQHLDSAVKFSGNRRPHVSLNVTSVKESLQFYQTLFNRPPSKLMEDYAKFEPETPPVNFTINQHPDKVDRDGHFGIEVKSSNAVKDYYERFKRLNVSVDAEEREVACCFSVQNKVWVADPDGNHWEVFVVVDGDADEGCEAGCICYDPETESCKWS
ncbi:MAG: VOC family protein [Candidatus Thiodiazotropha sp. (ex Epidulcina cf. delphinae)]|nr:VOC family protein [Candidatus Thiodiazotropha sp. (ex Epidulcina cf. delphinae)]